MKRPTAKPKMLFCARMRFWGVSLLLPTQGVNKRMSRRSVIGNGAIHRVRQACRQEMKWVFFVKKVENGGGL